MSCNIIKNEIGNASSKKSTQTEFKLCEKKKKKKKYIYIYIYI